MVTEYVDCSELKRLIIDKKVKPATLKYYLRKKGIIFTASNPEQFAEQVFTIFLGAKEISEIKEMMINEGNYEKSLVMHLSFTTESEEEDIIEVLIDEMNKCKSVRADDYEIEKPVRTDDGVYVQFSYTRKLPGRNKLLEIEKRLLKVNMRKVSNKEVVVDIRQQSSIDSKNAIGFIEKITNTDKDLHIGHINLENLNTKNKVEFFDRIAAYKFKFWNLQNITSITVKQGIIDEDEDEEEMQIEDTEDASTLSGISQAVLNGSGLRSNEFVQQSIEKGYYISAMRYRYEHKIENTEFAVIISFKKKDLRVDIDKTYLDDEGKIYIQPLLKKQQDEIVINFQNAAFKIYNELLIEQTKK